VCMYQVKGNSFFSSWTSWEGKKKSHRKKGGEKGREKRRPAPPVHLPSSLSFLSEHPAARGGEERKAKKKTQKRKRGKEEKGRNFTLEARPSPSFFPPSLDPARLALVGRKRERRRNPAKRKGKRKRGMPSSHLFPINSPKGGGKTGGGEEGRKRKS